MYYIRLGKQTNISLKLGEFGSGACVRSLLSCSGGKSAAKRGGLLKANCISTDVSTITLKQKQINKRLPRTHSARSAA